MDFDLLSYQTLSKVITLHFADSHLQDGEAVGSAHM